MTLELVAGGKRNPAEHINDALRFDRPPLIPVQNVSREIYILAPASRAVQLDQRFRRGLDGVALERLAEHRTHFRTLREEDMNFADGRIEHRIERRGRELVVGLEQYLAGRRIHYVGRARGALEIARRNLNLRDPGFFELFQRLVRDAAAGGEKHLLGPRVRDGL